MKKQKIQPLMVLGRVKKDARCSAFGFKGYREIPSHIKKRTKKGIALVPNPEFAKTKLEAVVIMHPKKFQRNEEE